MSLGIMWTHLRSKAKKDDNSALDVPLQATRNAKLSQGWTKRVCFFMGAVLAMLCCFFLHVLFDLQHSRPRIISSTLEDDVGFKLPFTHDQLIKDLNFTIPVAAARRGLGHMGDMLRFDNFLRKVVVERKPPTVVMVGGSVTRKVGGWRGDQGQGLNKQHMTCEKHFCTSFDGWMASTLQWLTDTFPPTSDHPCAGFNASGFGEPPAKFQLINLAIGGRGADVYFACMGDAMLQSLPQDVDLVVMDFGVNGASMAQGWRSTKAWAERLMLFFETKYPGIAMVFVNWHHWCQKTLLSDFGCVSPMDRKVSVNRTWETMKGTFSLDEPYNNEDEMLILSQYYSIPLLSLRNVLYTLVASQVPGYGKHDIVAPGDQGTHPSALQATTLYSNVFVFFIYQAIHTFAERKQQNRLSATMAGHASLYPWPPPMYERLLDGLETLTLVRCYSQEAAELGFPSVHPPLILPNNNQGWQYGPDNDALVPNMKKGLITRTPGSRFELQMDTECSCEVIRDGKVMVRFWYLASYGLMGRARYDCVRGCSCAGGVIDALENAGVVRESVPKNVDVFVTRAVDCTIRFVSEAGPKGSKFKLLEFEVIGKRASNSA